MEQTYQQLLAEVYDENAKNVLIHQQEYDDQDQPPYERYDYSDNELDDKEEFNKFGGDRGKPEHVIQPEKANAGIGLTDIKKDSIFRMNLLNIDGNFRLNSAPPAPVLTQDCGGNPQLFVSTTAIQPSTNFQFRTSRQYKNVYSVQVSSIEFPNNFYAFSSQRGNTIFGIEYNNSTYTIQIPDGNYLQLVNATTGSYYSSIPSQGAPIVTPGTDPRFPHATVSVYTTGVPVPDTTTFLGAIQQAINLNIAPIVIITSQTTDNTTGNVTITQLMLPAIEVGYANNLHIVYFTQNNTALRYSPFSITFPSTETNSYGNGIGYNLGILELYVESKIQAPPGKFASPGLNQQTEYLPIIIADTFSDIIQDKYVYLKLSDWDLITHINPNQTHFTAFMKIVLNAPKYTIQFDNNNNNSTTKQYYFQQPTNINLISVSLLDAYGNLLDLKYSSFSLTLQIEECLSNATYEALLENK
uniref:Uncharacterized protein n=1 Tax=viral metagenome TaxID=1070528 RepID=A0A6C0JLP5_9ZZZZ